MPGVVLIILVAAGAKGKTMLKSTIVGAVVLAAVAVSPAAMADDRGVNTALGAVVGAA